MFTDTRLKAFEAVARCGSFTAAAKDLGISQPAVSQSVGALEQIAGCPLFKRVKGAVVLTEKGEAFLSYARRILYWYDELDAVVISGTREAPAPTVLDLPEGRQAAVSVVEGEIKISIL